MPADERVLIIPDIHTDFVDAETMIRREKPDRTVFLGDYFDSFSETNDTIDQTAAWLKDSISRDDRLHLIGNHDLSYMTDNAGCKCSGFTEHKKFIINRHEIAWEKLHPYCFVGDWLCTHAGLSRQFFEQYSKNKDVGQFMQKSYDDVQNMHDETARLKFFQAGRSRGGSFENGGIVWCDYDEFEDIDGIKQIFGHTRSDYLRQTENHICLDTGLGHYAVYENGQMRVRKYLP